MEKNETCTLGGGCFWCTEAIFKRLKGVSNVTSGYSGGKSDNPSYEQVSAGTSGHAESIQLQFDPKIISFEKLLEIFFHLHDPTTLNRQGNDSGEQYKSVIFYHNDAQKKSAEKIKNKIESEKVYKDSIVTQIVSFASFTKAEKNHQDYYDQNRSLPYCQVVIDPKIQKLLREFKEEVK